MPEPVRPFDHQDVERKTDEALRQEARAHLGVTPRLQLVAELLTKLRALDVPWWTPEALRARWPAAERMRWYRARPDLRQHITTALTGLAPKAARKKEPAFQGGLIDAVLDEGDVTARTFEEAFDPCDLVLYGPVDAFWATFMEWMPWGQDTAVHQELCAWLFDALLADHSAIDGMSRKPILTAWDARTAIDGRVWHTRMPLEIRVAIDEARLRKEHDRPGEPFHAESDLSIAVSATIATSIPLRDLAPVFVTAERAMGFPPSPRPAASSPQVDAGKSPPQDTAPPAKPAAAPAPKVAAPPPEAASPVPSKSVPPPAATATPLPASAPVSTGAPMSTGAPAGAPGMQPPPMMPGPPPMGAMQPPPMVGPYPAMGGPPPPAMVQRSPSTPPPPLGAPRRSDYPPPMGAVPPGARPLYPPPGAPPGGPPPGGPPPGGPPFQGAGPAPAPTDRPTGSAKFEPPPADRPTGSAKFEPPPQAAPATPAAKGEPAKAPSKSDGAAGASKPRSAMGTLIDALTDIPAEEERTNPWEIPGDDHNDELTGGGAAGRRDPGDGGGKRKRSGKA